MGRCCGITTASLLLVAAGVLSGCTGGATSAPPAAASPTPALRLLPTAGVDLPPRGRVAAGIDPVSIQNADPILAATPADAAVLQVLYDSLVWVDRDGRVQPGLARGWRAITPTTWEFTLGDYRFHNGRSVSPADVAASLDRARSPASRVTAAAGLDGLLPTQIINQSTLRLTTREPLPTLLRRIGQVLIVPDRELREAGPAFFDQPIGSGPFRPVSLDWRSALTFDAVPAAAGTPRGRPRLAQLELRFILDPRTAVASVRSGELDLAMTPTDQLRGADGLSVLAGLAPATWSVGLDLLDGPTSDRRVRQALNLAIDRPGWNQRLYAGLARSDAALIGPGVTGFDQRLAGYPHDPPAARRLLAEAGLPAGFAMPLHMPNSLGGAAIARALAQDLALVGVRTDIELREPETWAQAHLGPPDQRRGVLFGQVLGWGGELEPDPWRFYARRDADGARGWSSAPFLDLWSQAASLTDDARRGAVLRQAGRVMHEDAPAIFLWQLPLVAIARPGISWTPAWTPDTFTSHLASQ